MIKYILQYQNGIVLSEQGLSTVSEIELSEDELESAVQTWIKSGRSWKIIIKDDGHCIASSNWVNVTNSEFRPEPNYKELEKLRGEEILELRAKTLRFEWQLSIAKTRLRLIRRNAEFLRKTHVEYPGLWREFDEIVDLVDGTSTELESEIGLDGQPHKLDESEIERRRSWKPY